MLRPSRLIAVLLACVFVAGAVACSSKLDQAAKARVFSPEDPAPDIQRAKESINVADAVTDRAVWDRLWQMDRLEVTRRIGAHRAHATVHFKWTMGDRHTELNEDQVFETDANGQFRATVTNDQGSGFEFIWVNGKAYARGRYGSFHERRTDRAEQDGVREQATSAMRTAYDLFQRRLSGVAQSETHLNGRSATRFGLELSQAQNSAPTDNTPAPVYGKQASGASDPGPDPDTAHRLSFDHDEQPEHVSGDVVIDDTGVILKSSIRANFVMAEGTGQSRAVLDLDVSYELDPKPTVAITVPRDVVALKLPHTVNDPLWFTKSSAAAPAKDEEEDHAGEDDESAPAAHSEKPSSQKH